jgi:hypothetical protein
VNVRRVGELTAEGLMHPAGLAAFERRSADRTAIYSYEQRRGAELDAEQNGASGPTSGHGRGLRPSRRPTAERRPTGSSARSARRPGSGASSGSSPTPRPGARCRRSPREEDPPASSPEAPGTGPASSVAGDGVQIGSPSSARVHAGQASTSCLVVGRGWKRSARRRRPSPPPRRRRSHAAAAAQARRACYDSRRPATRGRTRLSRRCAEHARWGSGA